MKKQPLVYIIILNWNGFEHTKECLASLKKNSYKNYQIVLVDNGSLNNEANRLKEKFPNVILIKNKTNRGYSKANNQGMKMALNGGAKYILLLNNDTVVKKNFLDKLVGYAEKRSFKGILTPKILYYNTNLVWAMGGTISILTSIPRMIGQGKKESIYKNVIKPDYASGCAFFVNSIVLKKVGYFDDRFFAYYEDADLSYRVREAGFEIRVIPDSVVWHKVSQSTKHKGINKLGERQAYLYAKNGFLFGLKNLSGISKVIYLFSQYTIKYLLYLLFKVDSVKAAIAYSRGLVDGSKYLKDL